MRVFKKIVLCFAILQTICFVSFASSEEILETQKDSLNMSSFIKEADKYTEDVFPDLDINELLNAAIQGKTDTSLLYRAALSILGKEVVAAIKVLRKCIGYCNYT